MSKDRETVGRVEAFVIWMMIWFAVIGLFHYRSQIRDLRRRISVLEQQQK